jgi:hypothetical protein
MANRNVTRAVRLALIAAGMDSYEAHARRAMGYTDPRPLKVYVESPDCPEDKRNMRQFAKCRRLGLQFGLGHVKFVSIVKEWANIVITASQSKSIVNDFRAKETQIVALWKQLDNALKMHARRRDPEPFVVDYPSGRSAHYFDVRQSGDDGLKARTEMGGLESYLYGAMVFQGTVQGTARDLLVEAIRRVHNIIGQVVLHVHDELIVECAEESANDCLRVVRESMINSMESVFPEVPIVVEGAIHQSWGEK